MAQSLSYERIAFDILIIEMLIKHIIKDKCHSRVLCCLSYTCSNLSIFTASSFFSKSAINFESLCSIMYIVSHKLSYIYYLRHMMIVLSSSS